MDLTSEQRKAVESTSPFVGVIAGAGTGKTHLLTAKVKNLIDSGSDPRSILLLTFTNRAASQLREELAKVGVSRVRVGTFHSVAYSLNTDYSVMSPSRAEDVAGKIAKSAKDSDQESIYKSWMRVNKQADFQFLLELLHESVMAGKLDDIKHVLIDEAQDTDIAQWAVVDLLTAKGASLFAVGDPKQQVYEWRGAKSSYFTDRIEERHVLTKSFRFGKSIAAVHNRLCPDVEEYLEGNEEASGVWIGSSNVGDQVQSLMDDHMFAPRDIAVLCRTNFQVKLAKKSLDDAGVPFEEDASFDCAELDVLKFICNPSSTSDRGAKLLHSLPSTHPLFGISTAQHLSRVWINKWLAHEFVVPTVHSVLCSILDGIEFSSEVMRIVESVGDLPIREGVAELTLGSSEIQQARHGVTVCTVHQAKGLQFPAVVAISAGVKETPEEDRVALVQATRAQERLHVIDNVKSPGPLSRAAWTVVLREDMEDLDA
jgi:superfamily I DNA/RNA helicase